MRCRLRGEVDRRAQSAFPAAVIDLLESRVFFVVDSAVAAAHVDAKLLTFYDDVITSGQSPVASAARDHFLVQGPDRVAVTVQADNVDRVTAKLASKLGF
jgi:hypothetical protein